MANGNQISTSVTILNSLLGYQGISLTNFTTSAVSSIAAGSKIEIAGAFFSYSADDLPNASSWTAITTATTAYLALMPSGTAGSQIISASWTATAPTWSSSKQGWYATAASLVRVVASAYKSGATSQDQKNILQSVVGYRWQGKMIKLRRLVDSSPWTVPADVYHFKVWCVGGGGAGGAGFDEGIGNSGGGGSCIPTIPTLIDTIPGMTYSFVIGSGGNGNRSAAGGNGGDTTFTGAVTGNGGKGGKYNGLPFDGGRGAQNNPADGRPSAAQDSYSGGIGGGYGAGAGGTGNNPGSNATADTGSGGGGGGNDIGTSPAGGNGASGFIIIEY